MTSQECPILIHRTRNYITFYGKELRFQMKLFGNQLTLKQGDYPGLSGQAQGNHKGRILKMRDRGKRGESPREREDNGIRVQEMLY